MRGLPEVRDCPTREELCRHVDEVCEGVAALVKEVPPELMRSRAYPDGWSAEKNVQHVISNGRFVAKWIGLPAWFLRLFGSAPRPAKTAAELVATNRPGKRDYGWYEKGTPAGPEVYERLERGLRDTAAILKQSINRHSEEELDRLRGLFGGTSLRTFALFGLKHMVHHVGVARQRLVASRETAGVGRS